MLEVLEPVSQPCDGAIHAKLTYLNDLALTGCFVRIGKV